MRVSRLCWRVPTKFAGMGYDWERVLGTEHPGAVQDAFEDAMDQVEREERAEEAIARGRRGEARALRRAE